MHRLLLTFFILVSHSFYFNTIMIRDRLMLNVLNHGISVAASEYDLAQPRIVERVLDEINLHQNTIASLYNHLLEHDHGVCSICGKSGHISTECHNVRCVKCGYCGHIARHCWGVCPVYGNTHQDLYWNKGCDDVCIYCGDRGHISRECHRVSCIKCGEVGHFSAQCNNVHWFRCITCCKTWHIGRNCYNVRCMKYGHIAWHFWVVCGSCDDTQDGLICLKGGHGLCTSCGKRGHFYTECNNVPCIKCGKVGHIARDCWAVCSSFGEKHRGLNCWNGGLNDTVCTTCGESGHISTKCIDVPCIKCGMVGHTETQCYPRVGVYKWGNGWVFLDCLYLVWHQTRQEDLNCGSIGDNEC
ncbi:protein RNA-directed DNA methylation 3 isoform X2 [Tanacetum coccineum]